MLEGYEPYGVLQKIKKSKHRVYKIISFDTENDPDGSVTIINFYDGLNHYTFYPQLEGFDRCHKWIYSVAKKNVLFVAHNLEYDIVNLMREVKFYFMDKMMYAGTRLITCSLKDSTAKFVDSYNFFAGKLSDMAKIVGMEKGNYEEARATLEQNTEYCRDDCLILHTFMQRFQSRVNDEFGLTLPTTIGRISLDSFRRNYQKENLATYNAPECLKAYAGGRVECFEIGEYEGEVVLGDVNSMYPDKMQRDFPDCDSLKEGVDPLKTIYGIAEVEIYLDPEKFYIGPLCYNHNGKLSFPVGLLKSHWTFLEIQKAVKLGAEIRKVFYSIGTNRCVKEPFKEWVIDQYTKRKSTDDKFLDALYKLILNNGYGKFGQHNDSTTLTTTKFSDEDCIKNGYELKDIKGPFFCYTQKMLKPPKFACYLWASYITAYARDHLLDLLLAVHNAGHKVLYCDTDSVMYVKQNKTTPYRIGKGLGLMGDDYYKKVEIFTLKGYVLTDENDNTKIASKGVPNEYALDFFKGKTIEYRKPIKLKEGYKRNELLNFWELQSKKMQSQYDKRVVSSDGTTKPHNLNYLQKSG